MSTDKTTPQFTREELIVIAWHALLSNPSGHGMPVIYDRLVANDAIQYADALIAEMAK